MSGRVVNGDDPPVFSFPGQSKRSHKRRAESTSSDEMTVRGDRIGAKSSVVEPGERIWTGREGVERHAVFVPIRGREASDREAFGGVWTI